MIQASSWDTSLIEDVEEQKYLSSRVVADLPTAQCQSSLNREPLLFESFHIVIAWP
jgi:hypothetical protein